MSASLVPPPVPADCLHGFFYSNTGKKKKGGFFIKKKQTQKPKTKPNIFPSCSALQFRSTRSEFWLSLLVAPFSVDELIGLNHSHLTQAAWASLGSANWEIWN